MQHPRTLLFEYDATRGIIHYSPSNAPADHLAIWIAVGGACLVGLIFVVATIIICRVYLKDCCKDEQGNGAGPDEHAAGRGPGDKAADPEGDEQADSTQRQAFATSSGAASETAHSTSSSSGLTQVLVVSPGDELAIAATQSPEVELVRAEAAQQAGGPHLEA